jgi:hypothetical protein
VRSRWCPGPLALVLGFVGAFLGVLALSALFAHPAGASTLPGPGTPSASSASSAPINSSTPINSSGTPALAVVSDTTQSASALLGDVVNPDGATPASNPVRGSNPAAGRVVTLVQTPGSALPGLAPVIQPITTAIAAPLGQIVTTLLSVPTSITGIVPPVAQSGSPFGVGPGTDAITIHHFSEAHGAAGNPFALGVHPSSPRPLPGPARPLQGFPLVTSSSPTADSSSSSGGSALAAAPVSGPLLPNPLVSGAIPEQSGVPCLLFDLRSSPPG